MKNALFRAVVLGVGIAIGFWAVRRATQAAGVAQALPGRGAPALVGGTIQGISTPDSPGTLMGQVTKNPGDAITISVSMAAQTTDFQGLGIPWNYRLFVEMRALNTNTLLEERVDLLVGPSSSLPPGNHILTVSMATPDAVDLSGMEPVLHFPVFLQAEQSDDQGNPRPGTFITVDQGEARNAVNVALPPTAGAALPAGSLGSISVTQRLP